MSPEFADILAAVILLFVVGVSVGNFATSIIYRLPRGLKVSNDPPYCDHCREYLSVRDLFPLVSWLINRGKCRFCAAPVPANYAVVEFLSAIIFLSGYFVFGVGDAYVLFLCTAMALVIYASIYQQAGRTYHEVLIAVFGLALSWRILHDGQLLGAISGAYMGLLLGLLIWGLAIIILKHERRFPHYVLTFVIAGLLLGKSALLLWFAVSAGLWGFLWLLTPRSEGAAPLRLWVIAASATMSAQMLYMM